MGQTTQASAKKLAEAQKKKKMKIAIAILIVVIIAIIVILILLRNQDRDVVTPRNAEQVAQEMLDAPPVEQGYYRTIMNTHWHFSDGKAVSEDAWVENSSANNNDVYFDVYLEADESEPIYESPVLTIGSRLDKIKLDTPLDSGTYDCVAVYNLVDENQDTVSTVRVGFQITVE